MLRSISVRNFQCHRDLTVEFDPQITAIHGPTDAGKSAILRALKWLCFNRPSGDTFKRDGAKFVSVTAEVGKHTVKRKKGQKNLYVLDGKQYTAFGNNVPGEISKLLNVDETNFQGQFDPVFWLSDSAGEVSKSLNRIISLEAIDRSLANVASKLRQAVAERDVSEARLSKVKTALEDRSWVPSMIEHLEGVEHLYRRIEAQRSTIACLRSALKDVKRHEQARDDAGDASVGGRKLVKLGQRVLETRGQVESLTQILNDCSRRKDELCRFKRDRDATMKKLASVKKCPLCGSRTQKSSPSAAQTCTSQKIPPLPGQLSLIG